MPGQAGDVARSAAWGVVAAVLGGGAFETWMEAESPASTFPAWPALVFSALTLTAIYLCFGSLCGRWPLPRRASLRADRRTAAQVPRLQCHVVGAVLILTQSGVQPGIWLVLGEIADPGGGLDNDGPRPTP